MRPDVGRRRVNTAVALSPFTFGSMRLDTAGGAGAVAGLIGKAIDLGVTTFHVSSEYAAWPLFVEAWNAVAPGGDVQVVAKIGVPHFGEDRFDPVALRDKVDAYRTALNLDQLTVVQWLLRFDLKDEAGRLAILDRDAAVIAETVQTLRDSGTIGAMVSFPYTRGVADRALAAPWCDGLAVYCNPFELDMTDLFDTAQDLGKAVIAIRPFAAGRVFTETSLSAGDAVRFPLSHPAVATVVASTSSPSRLEEAANAARSAASGRWDESLRQARELVHV